jgi:aminobenzoyl-glutamate utilization protein B
MGNDSTTSASAVDRAVDSAGPAIDRICAEVWELAEISQEEVGSAAVHRRELEAAGFVILGTGTSGLPTAFLAEWRQGQGGPLVGFLPEYDALPGLGNVATPRQEPRADGKTSGHGCGHNMLGAALTGAAIAAKRVMEAGGIAGTLRVFGCAAEETEGAKVYMARDGLFNDLDACLHWHPAPIAAVMNVRLSAANLMTIEFRGQTAHAGNEPWSGRSAVHAMELAVHGLNVMREHLEPTARTHYILESGGLAPNVVPDYARLRLVVRDADRARVVATTEWVHQIAAGAAMATQTESSVNAFYGLHDLLPNTPLAERMQAHLEAVRVPAWSEEEQAFARACQHELGLDEHGLATSVLPLMSEPTLGGSSDVGEASWNTPTMGIAFPTMPLGVSLHSWPVTACGGMSIGRAAARAAARVLARTALDVLTDADLRAAARSDFARRTEGFTYVSPLPPTQAHPVGLPTGVTTDGTTALVSDMAKQRARNG